MRNFNRVFLSITLLLGTVFAGAVLPTQAGAVGFAPPSGIAIEGQVYTETPIANGYRITASWSQGPADGETGTFYVEREINSYFSLVFESRTVAGTCTVSGGTCFINETGYNGIPSNYPAGDTQARAKYTLVFNPNVAYYSGGQEFWMHKSFLQNTNTYVSIDDSSTVYGESVTLSGWVRAETDTAIGTGTIYFYDLGGAPFTDYSAEETITGGDTSTAIGSCAVSAGVDGNIGNETATYPGIWSGGCQLTFSTDGINGKFHSGSHNIIAKYVDDDNPFFRAYTSSWSDDPRNFEAYELQSVDLTVSQAELTFSPDDLEITYGDDIPDYSSSNVTGFVYGDSEGTNYVFNGTGWGLVTLPTCTSDYVNNSESGTVGDYPISCDTSVSNYDYVYVAEYGEPNLAVVEKDLTVTPNNQTIVYGDAVPDDIFYTAEYDGFVYGESRTVLDPDPVFGSDYAEDTAAGTLLPITSQDFGLNGNYNVIVETGTLTVTKAPLHIYAPKYDYTAETPTVNDFDFTPYTVIYADEALPVETLEADTLFVGFKNEEDVADLTSFSCSSDYDNFTHVGDTEGALINCAATSNNYAITFHDGAYLVNPATLNVYSAYNITVPRGTIDVNYLYNVEGFLNGETQFNALDYQAPSCGSGYTPELPSGTILPITCSGLSANDYVAVYETGTAVTIQGPAAFPTTTNLYVLDGTESILQGQTIKLRAVVCSGLNAHPGVVSNLCPGVNGDVLPTILPSSAVVFTINDSVLEQSVGYCTLSMTISNDCYLDIPTDYTSETGTFVVKAYYYGTNPWGSSYSETRTIQITSIPGEPLPYTMTYHLTDGPESGTVFVESGTAGMWTAMHPSAMGGSFNSRLSSYTFNYWIVELNPADTITAGYEQSLPAGATAHLYGNWTIKSSGGGGGGGGYVPPANVVATVSVTGPTYTYDAAPHGASATTNPAGLAVTVTYNGSTTPPTNAGTYTVVATVTASGYTGTATSTLVINKATPTISWGSPAAVDEGTALSGAQLNAVGSIPGTLSYSPSAGFVPGAGTAGLSVTFTPTDSANWNNASKSVSLTVNAKAVVTPEPTPDPKPAPAVKNLVLGFSLSSAKISKADLAKIANASLDNPDAVITIVGYAQPSGNKAADLKLSRARANAVKAQILALNPDAVIKIIAKGSAINKTCKKTLNKCAIVSVA